MRWQWAIAAGRCEGRAAVWARSALGDRQVLARGEVLAGERVDRDDPLDDQARVSCGVGLLGNRPQRLAGLNNDLGHGVTDGGIRARALIGCLRAVDGEEAEHSRYRCRAHGQHEPTAAGKAHRGRTCLPGPGRGRGRRRGTGT